MAIRLLSVVVLLLLFAFTASAQQIFKWKDKKGQWHFSDHPPAEIRAEQVKGLDIGPIPPMPPKIAEPPAPHAGSESTEQAVSKPQLTEEVSREQREYQKRLEEMTQQIKALSKRFDLVSKELHEAKGGGVISGDIVVSRTGMYRSSRNYPRLERELSKLTKQMERLFDKREKLIREMRQKGFETGYIPY